MVHWVAEAAGRDGVRGTHCDVEWDVRAVTVELIDARAVLQEELNDGRAAEGDRVHDGGELVFVVASGHFIRVRAGFDETLDGRLDAAGREVLEGCTSGEENLQRRVAHALSAYRISEGTAMASIRAKMPRGVK